METAFNVSLLQCFALELLGGVSLLDAGVAAAQITLCNKPQAERRLTCAKFCARSSPVLRNSQNRSGCSGDVAPFTCWPWDCPLTAAARESPPISLGCLLQAIASLTRCRMGECIFKQVSFPPFQTGGLACGSDTRTASTARQLLPHPNPAALRLSIL